MFAAAPVAAPTKGLVKFANTAFKNLVPKPSLLANSSKILVVLSPSSL